VTEAGGTSCVLLSCSTLEHWALPQNCLAEILAPGAGGEAPDGGMIWRGREVPVLESGAGGVIPWRRSRGAADLVAILIGRPWRGCDYFGVAVRAEGLAVVSLRAGDLTEAPGREVQHARAAFHLGGVLYQVPDLDALQRRASAAAAMI